MFRTNGKFQQHGNVNMIFQSSLAPPLRIRTPNKMAPLQGGNQLKCRQAFGSIQNVNKAIQNSATVFGGLKLKTQSNLLKPEGIFPTKIQNASNKKPDRKLTTINRSASAKPISLKMKLLLEADKENMIICPPLKRSNNIIIIGNSTHQQSKVLSKPFLNLNKPSIVTSTLKRGINDGGTALSQAASDQLNSKVIQGHSKKVKSPLRNRLSYVISPFKINNAIRVKSPNKIEKLKNISNQTPIRSPFKRNNDMNGVRVRSPHHVVLQQNPTNQTPILKKAKLSGSAFQRASNIICGLSPGRKAVSKNPHKPTLILDKPKVEMARICLTPNSRQRLSSLKLEPINKSLSKLIQTSFNNTKCDDKKPIQYKSSVDATFSKHVKKSPVYRDSSLNTNVSKESVNQKWLVPKISPFAQKQSPANSHVDSMDLINESLTIESIHIKPNNNSTPIEIYKNTSSSLQLANKSDLAKCFKTSPLMNNLSIETSQKPKTEPKQLIRQYRRVAANAITNRLLTSFKVSTSTPNKMNRPKSPWSVTPTKNFRNSHNTTPIRRNLVGKINRPWIQTPPRSKSKKFKMGVSIM